jgi:hypothetical protein
MEVGDSQPGQAEQSIDRVEEHYDIRVVGFSVLLLVHDLVSVELGWDEGHDNMSCSSKISLYQVQQTRRDSCWCFKFSLVSRLECFKCFRAAPEDWLKL